MFAWKKIKEYKFKGALDNIIKFSSWLNFIYYVKSDLLTYKYKKKTLKRPSDSEEIIIFF